MNIFIIHNDLTSHKRSFFPVFSPHCRNINVNFLTYMPTAGPNHRIVSERRGQVSSWFQNRGHWRSSLSLSSSMHIQPLVAPNFFLPFFFCLAGSALPAAALHPLQPYLLFRRRRQHGSTAVFFLPLPSSLCLVVILLPATPLDIPPCNPTTV